MSSGMIGLSRQDIHSERSHREAIGAWQTLSSARPIRMPPSCPTCGGGHHLGYHTHYVVDGGKSRIILAALVTPSEVMENQPMRGSASFTRASAGNSGRARSPVIVPTAPSTIVWQWKISR